MAAERRVTVKLHPGPLNLLFEAWLTEIRDEAREAEKAKVAAGTSTGSTFAGKSFTYQKAIKNLKLHTEVQVIREPKDAINIVGIGDVMVKRLERRLKIFRDEYGEPTLAKVLEIYPEFQARLDKIKSAAAKRKAAPPANANNPPKKKIASPMKAASSAKEYIPSPGTGNYAALIVLYRAAAFENVAGRGSKDVGKNGMLLADMKEQGAPLLRDGTLAKATATHHHDAWSNLKRLGEVGYVSRCKHGRHDALYLLEAGARLACRLSAQLEDHPRGVVMPWGSVAGACTTTVGNDEAMEMGPSTSRVVNGAGANDGGHANQRVNGSLSNGTECKPSTSGTSSLNADDDVIDLSADSDDEMEDELLNFTSNDPGFVYLTNEYAETDWMNEAHVELVSDGHSSPIELDGEAAPGVAYLRCRMDAEFFNDKVHVMLDKQSGFDHVTFDQVNHLLAGVNMATAPDVAPGLKCPKRPDPVNASVPAAKPAVPAKRVRKNERETAEPIVDTASVPSARNGYISRGNSDRSASSSTTTANLEFTEITDTESVETTRGILEKGKTKLVGGKLVKLRYSAVPHRTIHQLPIENESRNKTGGAGNRSVAGTGTISYPPGSYEIKMLIDTAETAKSKEPLQKAKDAGIDAELYNLSLSDYCWVARPLHAATDENTLVLDTLVERKKMDDLAHSIRDMRFKEQKHRLKACGASNVIYIVEDLQRGQSGLQDVGVAVGFLPGTLLKSMTSCRVVDGLQLFRTRDLSHTVKMLALITTQLKERFSNVTLKSSSNGYFINSETLPTLAAFHKEGKKSTRRRNVQQTLAEMLLRRTYITPEKAWKVTDVFGGTWSDLLASMATLKDDSPRERAEKLKAAGVGKEGESLVNFFTETS